VAICPVHIAGNAVPMKGVHELASRHGLWIIEDTCEALGTRNDGHLTGTTGDAGTFSFFFSHQITTIEGGMIVTPHDELAELFRVQRAHGWTRNLKNRDAVERQHPDIDPRTLFVNTGFSVRPTEINAAFGLEQLKKLDALNRRRQEIAARWCEALAPLGDSLVPMQTTPGTESTWFGFPVLCESAKLREGFQAYLEAHGIETRLVAAGNLARQPAMRRLPHRIPGSLRGADQIMDRALFWGNSPAMSDADVDAVARTVKGFFRA
jgi:CDP-6-deoxy-D-xylo-4-hexulose-3-dehydrase